MTRAVRIAALILSCALVGGCVTEERTPRADGSRTPAQLPEGFTLDGPIARPALAARNIHASVRAVIEPLGEVPFDGLVLPLVSPDATRLVTQTGTPPPWPTALGADDAGPSMRTRLEVYDITSAPPTRVRLDAPIEPGVLLGRSANDRGFLVEEPRPDGSRRIGIASWTTGAIDWLADEAGVVYAGATLTADGDLVASRRRVGAPSAALWSMRLGELARDDDVAYAYPLDAGTPGQIGALALARAGATRLTWWSISAGQPVVRARRRLLPTNDMIGAYQVTDPFRSLVAPTDAPRPGVLLFSPGAARVVFFDPTTADVVPLADKSIAGAWAPDEGGWALLLTTPRGLVHQRLIKRNGAWEALPPADVLADPYVARATRDDDRPFVLIGPAGGPDAGVTRRLSLVGLDLLFGDETR